MIARASIAICMAVSATACNDARQERRGERQQEHSERDEVAVIAHMLKGYSLGKDKDTPAAFSSLLGTAQAPQLSTLQPLKVEYFQEITQSICDDLREAGASIEAQDVEADEARLSEALASLRRVNRHSVEHERINGIATVSYVRLNRELLRIEGETDNADDWWKKFDETFLDYAGFASASRVGFSVDGQIAIVYFSWTAGPTLGVGGFHILKKYDTDWQRVGGFPIWTWTS